ncbi:MAG: hypothetical protein Q4F65_14770 [Propionibacteriaceae bacterium]|nr:hypothetical protein [Propionibacteriaceae bacterium]
MGFSGLIFAALAAFWLIYLVPLVLNRKENGLLEEVEPGEPFSTSVTIVRRGVALDTAENGTAVVSTPLNRRAALRELSDLDREAARRRRTVLVFLTLVTCIMGAIAGFGLVSWAWMLIPVGLITLFLVVARFSVRAMRRNLDARARLIRGGDSVDEHTVTIDALDEDDEDENEVAIELSGPIETTGALWDPIPITAPTYVSRPLAPRTVRTIDLSAPVPAASVPVTADHPDETDAPDTDSRPHAVGE